MKNLLRFGLAAALVLSGAVMARADAKDPWLTTKEKIALLTGQGTSYATPMTTSVIAILLSARPQMRPWELRQLLYRTSDHASAPDTAYGHGVINCGRALSELSRPAPVVGFPRAAIVNGLLAIAAGLRY